ncbi:hypothetical protein LIER_40967 [Lithospermum erythrorhizon]|uniref:Uncharacterized protein n=1 Tax=Lithospermum erythrorhizon TaxID=34254 RepID=A0AAV3R5W1_LITER
MQRKNNNIAFFLLWICGACLEERFRMVCVYIRNSGGQEELSWWMAKIKGKSLWSVIFRIALCSTVYWIWRERNGRLHGRQGMSEQVIFEKVVYDVSNRFQDCMSFEKNRRDWECSLE